MSRITPQLAVDFDPAKARYPLMAFRKIDGVRAGRYIPEGGLTGRSMDPFKNSAVVALYADERYAGFDGEITIDGRLKGDDLCSLTTGLMNRAKVAKGEDSLPINVVWNLFDYLHPDVVHLPYIQRLAALARVLGGYSEPLLGVHLLPWVWIRNEAEAIAFIEESVELGFEGAIFRDPDAMHKSGRATAKLNDFWRHKPVSDKDAIVTGYEEALENQNEAKTNSLGRTERSSHQENLVGKGMVGTILATDVLTGKPIRLGPGTMKHDERLAEWEAYVAAGLPVLNKPCKYASLDTGVKDQPRQARWISWRAAEDMS
jgi:DNA ligase-1